MDPNAAWQQMVGLSERIQAALDAMGEGVREPEARRLVEMADALAERTLALREWVESGGFPPKAFQK